MIKSIIFDWGGVLIDEPTQEMYSYFARALGVSEDSFAGVFEKFDKDFDTGTIRENSLWSEVCSRLRVRVPATPSLCGEALRKVYSPKEGMFSLASHLHNTGYKIGFLSNTSAPSVKYFQEQRYDMFDVTVFSCTEGTAKPEEKIYRIALERLKVKPDESIFIDDRPENIRAAERLGMNAILFRNPSQVKKDLASFSVKID